MQKLKALFIKYFNIVVAFILFFSLSINCFALATTPKTDHIPEGYKYYASINKGTCKYVFYFKTLPHIFICQNDSYLSIYSESMAHYTFYSDQERDYHYLTKAGYANSTSTVSLTTDMQKIEFHHNDIVYANFSFKTTNDEGKTYTFNRTDETLTSNYESITKGKYDGTNGEYEEEKESTILEAILSIPTKIIEFFQSMFEKLFNLIQSIVDFVTNFFSNVVEFIKYLFIPPEGYMSEQMNKFLSNFAWVDRLKKFASDFFDMMNAVDDTNPPALTVDLSKINSKYWKAEGTVNVLSLDWFWKYKQYSDPLISAFLWLAVCWRYYCKIPDIIHGVGSNMGSSNHSDGKGDKKK